MVQSDAGSRNGQGPEQAPLDLAAALQDADLACLRMVLVHLTGDRRWLDPPDPGDEEARVEVLVAAEEAIGRSFAGHGAALTAPAPDLFAAMLSACVDEPVPTEYTTMVLEEMRL